MLSVPWRYQASQYPHSAFSLSVIKYHTYFGAFTLCLSSQKNLKVQLITFRKIKSYAISVHILFALVWIGKGSLWCSSRLLFMLMFILYVGKHAHTDLSLRNGNPDDSLIKFPPPLSPSSSARLFSFVAQFGITHRQAVRMRNGNQINSWRYAESAMFLNAYHLL